MVVHEDGGPKVREVKTKSSRAIPVANCSRSFSGIPRHLEMEAQLRRVAPRRDVVRSSEG
jgi:hypothetical protein